MLQKNFRPWLTTIVTSIALFLLFGCSKPSKSNNSKLYHYEVGKICKVKSAVKYAPVARGETELEELTVAQERKKNSDVAKLLADSRVFAILKQDRVKVLSQSSNTVQIEILEGEFKSFIGFVWNGMLETEGIDPLLPQKKESPPPATVQKVTKPIEERPPPPYIPDPTPEFRASLGAKKERGNRLVFPSESKDGSPPIEIVPIYEIVPPRNGMVLISLKKSELKLGKGFEEIRAKRIQSGDFVVLLEKTTVEVVELDKEFPKFIYKGKTYFVESKYLKEKEKE